MWQLILKYQRQNRKESNSTKGELYSKASQTQSKKGKYNPNSNQSPQGTNQGKNKKEIKTTQLTKKVPGTRGARRSVQQVRRGGSRIDT